MSILKLKNLPHEIIADILTYLDRDELMVASTICKLFNEVISNSKKILSK